MSADTRGIRERADEWVKENYMKLPGSGGAVIKEAMARFAESEREQCCKDVCVACRTGARLILTDAGTYTHEEGYCRAAAIRVRARQEGS